MMEMGYLTLVLVREARYVGGDPDLVLRDIRNVWQRSIQRR
jgi:hypothetical protein